MQTEVQTRLTLDTEDLKEAIQDWLIKVNAIQNSSDIKEIIVEENYSGNYTTRVDLVIKTKY